jgi:hypothetical protein
MTTRFNRGSSNLEEVLILTGLLIIIFFFIIPNDTPSLVGRGTYDSGGVNSPTSSSVGESAYSKAISLGQGTASSGTEARNEHITITNRSTIPITITGWKLKSTRGEVVIPQGYRTAVSQGSIRLSDVVLEPGEVAVVATGPIDGRVSSSVGSGDRIWWVYLGRDWEMWGANYETISLLDRLGKLVTSISY